MLFDLDLGGEVIVGVVGKRGTLYWSTQSVYNFLRCQPSKRRGTTFKDVAMKYCSFVLGTDGLVMKLVTNHRFTNLIKESDLKNVQNIHDCFERKELFVHVSRKKTHPYLRQCLKKEPDAQNFFYWIEIFKAELMELEASEPTYTPASPVPNAAYNHAPTHAAAAYSPTSPAPTHTAASYSLTSPEYVPGAAAAAYRPTSHAPTHAAYRPTSPEYAPGAVAPNSSPAYSPSDEALYVSSSPLVYSPVAVDRPTSSLDCYSSADEALSRSPLYQLADAAAATAKAAAAAAPRYPVRSPSHPPPESTPGLLRCEEEMPYSPSNSVYSPSSVQDEPLDLSREPPNAAAAGGFTIWFDSFPPKKMFMFHGNCSYKYEQQKD